MGLGCFQCFGIGRYGNPGFKGFADEFFLTRLFQFRKRTFAQGKEIFPISAFLIGKI